MWDWTSCVACREDYWLNCFCAIVIEQEWTGRRHYGTRQQPSETRRSNRPGFWEEWMAVWGHLAGGGEQQKVLPTTGVRSGVQASPSRTGSSTPTATFTTTTSANAIIDRVQLSIINDTAGRPGISIILDRKVRAIPGKKVTGVDLKDHPGRTVKIELKDKVTGRKPDEASFRKSSSG